MFYLFIDSLIRSFVRSVYFQFYNIIWSRPTARCLSVCWSVRLQVWRPSDCLTTKTEKQDICKSVTSFSHLFYDLNLHRGCYTITVRLWTEVARTSATVLKLCLTSAVNWLALYISLLHLTERCCHRYAVCANLDDAQ